MKSILISLILLVSCSKLNGSGKIINRSGEVLKIVEIKTNNDKFVFKNVNPNESKDFKFEFKENGQYNVTVTRSNNTTFERTVGFYNYGFKASDEIIVTDSDVLIENQ